MPIVAFFYRLVFGDGVVRRQVAAPLIPIAFGLLVMVGLEVTGLADSPGVGETIGVVAVITITVGAPIGIGVAVTRYRLYEIDRIISRTVSYAIVVGLLGAVVALVATAVSTRFDSPLMVAATTLGIAAAFNPLRHCVQRIVDRRFNRSKYEAERVMTQSAETLRGHLDSDGLVDGWVGVVSETMQPSGMGVWVRR